MIAWVVAGILGCGPDVVGHSSDSEDSVLSETKLAQEVWVCHHPGTKHHNKRCIEDVYPEGCFVSGDTGKFCWLLTNEDCEETDEENKFDACALLESQEIISLDP